eukprot:CAMPEP_0115001450 /NCGR_PEP_ID=MMETSP0216-20121206/17389_1 /TAXON_ID=223996 /ORGANISM="Protocruzia adherens, Strain Boccale" /LENGTH=147 /DNA_ID=CAMNT_0002366799 /DNA_START=18 /DNA_END=461 /DNA_ORIENTATION=-
MSDKDVPTEENRPEGEDGNNDVVQTPVEDTIEKVETKKKKITIRKKKSPKKAPGESFLDDSMAGPDRSFKKMRIAKKVQKSRNDDTPIPGSVQDDLTDSPANFLKFKQGQFLEGGFEGPRFDGEGNVLSRSILGSVESFERMKRMQD